VIGALRFLHRVTLDQPEMVPHLPYPSRLLKNPVKLIAPNEATG
jgi:hypothetical protein